MDLFAKLREVSDLPTIPTAAARIIELADREDATPHELAEVVMADPALSARILRVANSPVYALQWPVSDIEKAIFMLGFAEVRALALSIGVFDSLYIPMRGGLFDRARFWSHSFVVAMLSRELAQARDLPAGPAFAAGLLHDIGKIALDRYFSGAFREIISRVAGGESSFAEVEAELLETTHAAIGGFLLRHWRLPETLAATAADHHQPESSDEPMAAIGCAANLLAHAAGFGTVENERRPSLEQTLRTSDLTMLHDAGRLPPLEAMATMGRRAAANAPALAAQAARLI